MERSVSDAIKKALELATIYGQIEGAHHKAWVIDQMVRALTECPTVAVTKNDWRGTAEVDAGSARLVGSRLLSCVVSVGEFDEATRALMALDPFRLWRRFSGEKIQHSTIPSRLVIEGNRVLD
jgi:hypothetical protein